MLYGIKLALRTCGGLRRANSISANVEQQKHAETNVG